LAIARMSANTNTCSTGVIDQPAGSGIGQVWHQAAIGRGTGARCFRDRVP
jgi:hypothetical protein